MISHNTQKKYFKVLFVLGKAITFPLHRKILLIYNWYNSMFVISTSCLKSQVYDLWSIVGYYCRQDVEQKILLNFLHEHCWSFLEF